MSLLPVSAIPVEGGYNINNSLRLRASAGGRLSRTFGTPTNTSTWTFSAWIKRGDLAPTTAATILASRPVATTTAIYFNTAGNLVFWNNEAVVATSTAIFRDPAAWYHVVVSSNGTTTTAYVNNETVLTWTGDLALINNSGTHYIGHAATTGNRDFDGYFAETYFVDGQALTPSSFGETNTTTGVWQPKAYSGTYGNNGFYEKYSDPSVFPVLVNTTVTSQPNTAQATITVNVPSGVNNGDLLILVVNGGNSTVYTTPAGWTLWFPTTNVTAIYYRVASSEPASYTVTGSVNTTAQGFMLAYRNATVDVMGTLTGGSGSNPIVAPAITTTANNTIVIAFFRNNTASDTFSTPSGYTALVSETTSPDPSGAIFTKTQATAGSTGTVSSTPTTTNGRGILFSIKPISNTNLGLDYSGNGNNWTTTNISVTAGSTYDAMTDSPTLGGVSVSNYCVVNPLTTVSGNTISNGNLTISGSGTTYNNTSTIAVTSGKWYYEVAVTSASNIYIGIGTSDGQAANFSSQYVTYRSGTGFKNITGTQTAYGATYTTGDTIGVAFDLDAGTIEFYKNNSNQGSITLPSSTINSWYPVIYVNGTINLNFGQQPFSYTPPTGFVRLNTFNLPTSTIVKGNSYMDATLYTGTGVSRSVTNAAAFRPDFVWIKSRSAIEGHSLYDVVRGTTNELITNNDLAATTQAQGLTAFNSNGFTVGTLSRVNTNTGTYVGWQWQAGSSTVTNTSGTISSQVCANTTTGFSIVTYTGTGANATVGHGLGVAPKLLIVKQRNAVRSWQVWHEAFLGTQYIIVDSTNNVQTDATRWNSTIPTSTVFSVGTANGTNLSGGNYLAYCWTDIAGFSAFGSYIGNGNTNGPFVYLGFRPKYVLIKNITTTGTSWKIGDSSRSPINVAAQELEPNSNNVEVTGTSTSNLFIDFLSNGFKLRGSANALNANASEMMYAAFAENPFKNALAR